MALIAALGMYDRLETAGAHDRFWALMRDALRDMGHDAPPQLTRGEGAFMPAWLSPNLLFAQTCSLPFRTALKDKVQIIATPDYGLDGCPAGYYRSVYVAKRDLGAQTLADLAGRPFAYNEALSHSGWAAPYAQHIAQGLALRPSLQTGAHRASAQAVADGRADYAAIDALSWVIIQRYDRFAADLVVVGHTPASPALPYITAQPNLAGLRAALTQTITALHPQDRGTLHLRAIMELPATAYLTLPIPPAPATK